MTGSRLTLGGKCLHWTSMKVPSAPPRSDSAFEASGTALHHLTEKAIETSAAFSREQATAMLERFKPLTKAELNKVLDWYEGTKDFLRKLPPATRTETAFAYNVMADTARELPTTITRRDYASCSDEEIPTTLDAWWVETEEDGTRTACVGDWETGWSRYKGRVRDSMTMALGALCVSRVYGCEQARVMIWRVTDDGIRTDSAMIGEGHEWSLDARAFQIASLHFDMGGNDDEPPPPQPGSHCAEQFCPALSTCALAQKGFEESELVQIRSQSGGKLKPAPKPVDFDRVMSKNFSGPEHVLHVLHRIKLVEAACASMRRAAEQWSDQHGKLPVEWGKVWGKQSITVVKLKPGQATADIVGKYIESPAPTPRAFSKTALKKALSDEKYADLIEELTAAGCTNATTTVKYVTHKGVTPSIDRPKRKKRGTK